MQLSPVRFAILLGLLAFSGCSATARPAFDTELYSQYRETQVTAQRGGVIGYFAGRKRGTSYECFPAEPRHEFRGFVLDKGTISRKDMELVGRVDAGDELLIHEIVYFDELPGLWARATVIGDDQSEEFDCIISATEGLKRHLLLTDEEIPAWLEIPEEMRENMTGGKVQVGMAPAHVLIAWGPPYKKITHRGAEGTVTESWVYQTRENKLLYVEFAEGRVVGMRE